MRFAGILIALVVLLSPPAVKAQADGLKATIVAQERQGLEDLKSGNIDHFTNTMADDAIFVDSHGSATKAEVIEHARDFRLTDFTIRDIRFVRVSPTAGLVLYQLDETGTSHGNAFTAKMNVSALWAVRDKKWVCLFSQETAARAAPAQ